MKEFEHYGDVTNKTPCRFCGFEFRGSVAQLEHHADKKHRMPNRQARQLVIAELDAVVDDNVVVADADAAARGICKVQTTLKTWLRNNRAQLGDRGDSLHASMMMQAPGLGLNLLSYRPTGLDN